ncbi:MAG: hypothetical protein Kapaf2KO_22420 [Candidatus Kapaibacteriales bacterium]
MNVQYIYDENEVATGVVIPIEDWENIKARLDLEEDDAEVPEWHLKILNERMEKYKSGSEKYYTLEDVDNLLNSKDD